MRKKLAYLQKQYLKYNGGLIALTIHPTMLTISQILILPYTDSDATLTNWWITSGIFPSGGLQHKAELDHIVSELTAVKPGIYAYCKDKSFLHVRVIFDNITAIAYINNMGGMKNKTGNNIGYRIWNFSIENKSWVADQQYRIQQYATKWKLHPELFHKLLIKFEN